MTHLVERRKPILIVQHAQHEHPAAVRRSLESQGLQTLWIHPYRGEEFPDISTISGMISLGGPMGANDDEEHPWIRQEVELLKRSIEADLPTVGICLGGQMMARAMGGRVERHTSYELGWFPIRLTEHGTNDPILGVAGKTPTVYQWHQDTFHLPPGATLLAGSKACPRQAYKLSDKVYGFQFHPEADHQLVHEWLSIEGVEQEIVDTQEAHGTETVQDAQTQRDRALKGEKASLKITTAMTSLFRRKHRELIRPNLAEDLQKWATRRKEVIVQFEGSNRKITHIQGRIATLLKIPAGQFAIIQEQSTLLWPIRIEDIREIELTK